MTIEFKVPELGESVVEATVGRWLKQPGEHVGVGDPLVEIQTDKVNIEVGAEREGTLSRIDRPEGQDVKVGDVLGAIDEVGAASAATATTPARATQSMAVQPPQAVQPTEQPAAANNARVASVPTPAPASANDAQVTPVARRMAEGLAVDLSQVTPSGASGRVTKDDVQRYVNDQSSATSQAAPIAQNVAVTSSAAQPVAQSIARPAQPAPSQATPSLAVSKRDSREERVTLSRRRRTIARRLVEAQHTAAMLTTFNEVDMTAVMEVREKRKEAFKEKFGVSLGINSFFIKAAIGALKQFPRLNAEIDGDEMILKHYYDIGVAIGAEEGLVVPVLRNADRMSFADVEKAIKKFAQQSTDGTLSLEDLRGGTFTITNGGVFGSLMSTPILNAPQVAILGLHASKQRPVVLNGQIVARPMMYIALSYDHRIVDGREAVQFLVRIKDLIEDPTTLLLEG